MNTQHIPVLLKAVLELLDPQPGDRVMDGTLGLGGHAHEILTRIVPDGHIYGFDLDQDNLMAARERLQKFSPELTTFHDSFAHCHSRLQTIGVSQVDKILLDLGLSSPHLDDPARGFALKEDGPLDMRFDRSSEYTAADLLNHLSEDELKRIFYQYGEERYAPKIARMVVERRKAHLFKTTFDLTTLIHEIMKNPRDQRHVAARIFQALRIAVNDELRALEDTLPQVLNLLAPGGRVVIISYHSLEDRLVKHAFREAAKTGPFELLTKKPIIPSDSEMENNPRSRSAKLRGLKRK